MAFNFEIQASQGLRTESNNNDNNNSSSNHQHVEHTKRIINNNNTKRNDTDSANGTNESSNQTEYRKSQRYNIDDPGASTSSGHNIRRPSPDLWRFKSSEREELLAKLQALASENRENSILDWNYDSDRYQFASASKNHTDQGASVQQSKQSEQQFKQSKQSEQPEQEQPESQQQVQPGRVNSASNSANKNTLFTRAGTNTIFSETCIAYDERFSKLYNASDSIPYRDTSLITDWDNIPTREVLQQLILSIKPSRERPDGRSTDDTADYDGIGDGNGQGFEFEPEPNIGCNGRYTADRCRYGVPPGYEWSNAYCYS